MAGSKAKKPAPRSKPARSTKKTPEGRAPATSTPKLAAADAKRPMAKLPAALAKRAEKEVAAKRARLAEEARADIALIRRKRERIAEDFYDIGEALVRLRRPGVAEAASRAPVNGFTCARERLHVRP